jgi:hypothetical protein
MGFGGESRFGKVAGDKGFGRDAPGHEGAVLEDSLGSGQHTGRKGNGSNRHGWTRFHGARITTILFRTERTNGSADLATWMVANGFFG